MTMRTAFGLLAAAVLFFGAFGRPVTAQESPPASPAPAPTLSDLQDLDQLQTLFNAQAGKPRLILLVAPT